MSELGDSVPMQAVVECIRRCPLHPALSGLYIGVQRQRKEGNDTNECRKRKAVQGW